MANPKADLVIGIDSSTSSCKAIVWDTHGRPLASARSPLPLQTPRPLWHEQPAEAWWQALVQVLREVSPAVDPARLAALCIACQRETFVPVDEAGRPLRPAILWMDERAGSLLPLLAQRLGADSYHRLTGKPLSGNLTIAKIAWLRAHEPELFRRVSKYLGVHAFLVQRLTGRYGTSWGCGDPMGLFDMQRRQWASQLLQSLEIRSEQLPPLYPPGAVIGHIHHEAAQTCHLPPGLPVVAGLGDGQAAGLGAGITKAGQAYLSLGTSVVSGSYASQYVTSRSFRTMNGGPLNTYLLETVILGGSYTLDWLANYLAAGAAGPAADSQTLAQRLNDEAARLPPGAGGLILVPYWNSAMNPYWDAQASGITIGWRGIHRPAHLYRAFLEGIGFELQLQLAGVEAALGRPVEQIVAVGGGAQNDLWCQIIADISGKPLVRAAVGDTVALGAGILAATAAALHSHIVASAAAMVHLADESTRPQARPHEQYRRLFQEVYRPLFPAIQQISRRLSDLTDDPAAVG